MKRNIKLTVEYDGTNYYGWQIQPSVPTIQNELKKAIFNITKENVTIIGSGRTDTGVHAKNQVAHFHTQSSIKVADFAKAINSQLPEDIVVKQSQLAEMDFHAQYQAKAKAYSYTIFVGEHRPAINRNYVYWIRRNLNVSLMREAASYLIGTHDFSSFEAAKSPRKSSIRTINKVDIQKENCYITTLLEANGFLYKMVRNIMGTLIEVGYEKYSPTKINEILKAKNRDFAGVTAPSHGLCLEYVLY
ncbi:tRNA pseudouridine(38-40) synthase TruA [Candidatus Uabimicrobium amorphum]|uniref:tRNA pseudouridine synthase A n=1 Tax=Uabimicrobium amorphum TaxID=2596890 RepID=A0A5S9IK39_UABAM|nr:tRNA pseudouridine(38-40) synthase TruA [Candidatus Uabimicrobium amorphum]BBM83174.1 tRNA pseudouridine synthase A [Candidatus Uabimicrobium amorphum]